MQTHIHANTLAYTNACSIHTRLYTLAYIQVQNKLGHGLLYSTGVCDYADQTGPLHVSILKSLLQAFSTLGLSIYCNLYVRWPVSGSSVTRVMWPSQSPKPLWLWETMGAVGMIYLQKQVQSELLIHFLSNLFNLSLSTGKSFNLFIKWVNK